MRLPTDLEKMVLYYAELRLTGDQLCTIYSRNPLITWYPVYKYDRKKGIHFLYDWQPCPFIDSYPTTFYWPIRAPYNQTYLEDDLAANT